MGLKMDSGPVQAVKSTGKDNFEHLKRIHKVVWGDMFCEQK